MPQPVGTAAAAVAAAAGGAAVALAARRCCRPSTLRRPRSRSFRAVRCPTALPGPWHAGCDGCLDKGHEHVASSDVCLAIYQSLDPQQAPCGGDVIEGTISDPDGIAAGCSMMFLAPPSNGGSPASTDADIRYNSPGRQDQVADYGDANLLAVSMEIVFWCASERRPRRRRRPPFRRALGHALRLGAVRRSGRHRGPRRRSRHFRRLQLRLMNRPWYAARTATALQVEERQLLHSAAWAPRARLSPTTWGGTRSHARRRRARRHPRHRRRRRARRRPRPRRPRRR